MFFIIDHGHSRISVSTSQGAHHQCFFALMVGTPGYRALPPRGPPSMFFALMVGAPGSLALPLRGPTIVVFRINGGRSWICNTTS
jgi:hypothetical protein